MVNCADCKFSYVDDLFGEWCCKRSHIIFIDPEINYPMDVECKDYKEDIVMDMRIKDLKRIINELPDDMAVVIPVIDEEDANHIYGFRKVRIAGILVSNGEEDREVLCINAAYDGQDIADQVYFSGRAVGVEKILFGTSKYSAFDAETIDMIKKGENNVKN